MWQSNQERGAVEREAQELLELPYPERFHLSWDEVRRFVSEAEGYMWGMLKEKGDLSPYEALQCILLWAGFPMNRLYQSDREVIRAGNRQRYVR